MDKLLLTIVKWEDRKRVVQEQMQEAKMAGASKKDISAMEAYVNTFQLFITDLYKLKD